MPVTERWVTSEEMAEAVKKAKVNRKTKLASFTRAQKKVQTLLDGDSENSVLKEALSEVDVAYRNVERAHEELCLLLGEDHEDAADTYLDDPSDAHVQIQMKVNKIIAERDKNEKEQQARDKVTREETERMAKVSRS